MAYALPTTIWSTDRIGVTSTAVPTKSGRTGFYLAVASEGEVGAGDEMRVISRDQNGVPVSEITRLYAEKRYSNADVTWVQRALRVAALPESWKEYFRQRLGQIPTLG